MEVTFPRRRTSNSIAFEVVIQGLDTADAPALRELQLGVLAEVGRIRVEERTRVAEGLEHEFGRRHLVAELGALLARLADAELEECLNGESAVLGLATTRLSAGLQMREGRKSGEERGRTALRTMNMAVLATTLVTMSMRRRTVYKSAKHRLNVKMKMRMRDETYRTRQ